MKRFIRNGSVEAMLEMEVRGGLVNASISGNQLAPRNHSLSVSEVEPGVYSVLAGTRAMEVRVTKAREGWTVHIAGRQFTIDVVDPREASACGKGFGRQGRQEIVSPMPGKVVRVLVEEGSAVEEGQGLIVVEAMKMQNEMKAPKAGKVLALAARAGASVTAGEVLVTLE
ncbi:MAG: biotin/lipoyl-binding protein [Acidobacteria bacterium]|nr:biotin/lipoyl-binding protein [Acidobacteriota bacterium]